MSLALLIAAQLSCPLPAVMAQAEPALTEILNPAAPPDDAPRNQAFFMALNRAKNLARATAERANGGLNRYSAESKMFGGGSQTDFVYKDGFFTFQFLGGVPGWQPEGLPPTVESVISVSFDGRTIRTDYNGPIRPETSTPMPAQPNCVCPQTQMAPQSP